MKKKKNCWFVLSPVYNVVIANVIADLPQLFSLEGHDEHLKTH